MQHHTKPFIMAVCAGSSVPARSGVEPPAPLDAFRGTKHPRYSQTSVCQSDAVARRIA